MLALSASVNPTLIVFGVLFPHEAPVLADAGKVRTDVALAVLAVIVPVQAVPSVGALQVYVRSPDAAFRRPPAAKSEVTFIVMVPPTTVLAQ